MVAVATDSFYSAFQKSPKCFKTEKSILYLVYFLVSGNCGFCKSDCPVLGISL